VKTLGYAVVFCCENLNIAYLMSQSKIRELKVIEFELLRSRLMLEISFLFDCCFFLKLACFLKRLRNVFRSVIFVTFCRVYSHEFCLIC